MERVWGGNQKCCLKCVPLHPDSRGVEQERETDKQAARFARIRAPLLPDRPSGQKVKRGRDELVHVMNEWPQLHQADIYRTFRLRAQNKQSSRVHSEQPSNKAGWEAQTNLTSLKGEYSVCSPITTELNSISITKRQKIPNYSPNN